LIAVRKIWRWTGRDFLFDDYRYFFYLTNDWQRTPTAIVLDATGAATRRI